jgi:hypothetical protein
MFARRPARHVEPDLTDDLESCQRIHPIHLRQVDPGHRGKIPVDIKAWGVTLACAPFACRRRWRGVDVHMRHTRLETHVNLRLTRLQLLLQKRLRLKGLLQRQAMLSPPVPFQGLGDRRLLVCATPIAVAGQTLGIALACEDGAENRHPRLPIQSADDLSPFEVHLLKSFRHMLHSSRGHGHQHTALP